MSNNSKKQAGFSLIEAIIAIFIVTIGLLGTAASITYALEYTAASRNISSAKLIITSTFEEIESLRNTRKLEFRQVANVGEVNNTNCPNPFSGFSNDFKEVSLESGKDGTFGTDDDLSIDAGSDGVWGTDDDVRDESRARGGYLRRITVTELSSTVKQVEVRIKYASSNGKMNELAGVCYLNNDFRLTR